MNGKSLIVLSLIILSTIPILPTANSQPTSPPGFKQTGSLPPDKEVLFAVYIPLKCVCKIFYYALETSNPSSPLYHQFLNKSQIQQFLPTEKYEEVLNQLKAYGFEIVFSALDSVIVAKGKVSQIRQYLGLDFVVYTNGTLTFYESYGTPKIPGVVIVSQNLTSALFSRPQFLITQKDVQSLASKIVGQVNYTTPIEAYWPTALQKVYNATALYEMGYYGQGRNIGILGFYGDPYIFEQLAYFDKVTGLPSTNLTVIPIGPYNPNLGMLNGWASEISLDVEVAHAMAPKANITLYVADASLPLSAIIAYIVNQSIVDVLSMSFGIPESILSIIDGQLFYTCIYMTDVYFALGTAEGITFLASSGDGGGSGYSNGPLGSLIYPSISPFVTAVGGTTTYIQFPGDAKETAWSNYGFVPNGVNFGGSTGGVSIVEPKPYYQWGLNTPSTYPNGKLVPEISANANIYPGIYIIYPGNVTGISGGTSEASPLIAGLLTLVMNYANTRLGNINPVIYKFGLNSTIYSKVFNPITFGYNIPWTASYGYNLVTGFGSLNVGEFAFYYKMTMKEKKGLSIQVQVLNSTGKTPRQYYPGEVIKIIANVTYNGAPVSSGSFTAVISNAMGNISKVALTYDPLTKKWYGEVRLPKNANGILHVTVLGDSKGVKGIGMVEIFSGYYVQFIFPRTFVPVLSNLCYIEAVATDSLGRLYDSRTLDVSIYKYCILNNSYTLVANWTLSRTYSGVWVDKYPSLPPGVYLMVVDNAFGFVAFTNGVSIQGIYPYGLYILPPVIVEPGSVSPGDNIMIIGRILPPPILQIYESASIGASEYFAVLFGSNVTAKLVSPEGKVVSIAKIYLDYMGVYYGELHVPKDSKPGLYTILLQSSYYSASLGQYINGSFFGQIYVQRPSIVKVSVPRYSFEGQTITIYANITYPNGTAVKYGMYSATVYPQSLCYQYSRISTMVEVPLWYNAKLGLWVGNVTLPSTLNPGNLTYLAGQNYYGGPFKILVTGISFDGYPTSTSPTNAGTTYVLPYTLIEGKKLTDFKTYNSALINSTIIINGTLINDVLVNDVIIGNVTIVNSNLTNVRFINSSVTLISTYGNQLHLENSKITLVNSIVNGITLINSMIILENSRISNVFPQLAKIEISSPTAGQELTGVHNISFNVIGNDVRKVMVLLDGKEIAEFNGSGTFTYALNTTKYPDGSHVIEVEAVQSDGLHSKSSVIVYFKNQLESLNTNLKINEASVNASLSGLSRLISSLNNNFTTSINNLHAELISASNDLHTLIYIVLVIAVLAIIIGLVAIVISIRKKK